MSFLEAITWDYILVCFLSLIAVVTMIIYRLRSTHDIDHDNQNDQDDRDDSDGGQNPDPDDPILDLPDGVVLPEEEEVLV